MPKAGGGSSSAAQATEKPVWLELAIQEYNAMRDEILTTMRTQDGTLRFGAAALGIVIAAGFTIWEDTMAATMIFLALVPFITTIVLIVWMGEVTRMMRAGRHILRLEGMLHEQLKGLPEPVMQWETNLRDPESALTRWERHYEWNYHAIVLMFWTLGIGSIVAAVYRGVWGEDPLASATALWAAASVVLVLTVIGLFLILRELVTVCDTQGRLSFLKKRTPPAAGAPASATGRAGSA